jgi:hypothetical protein
MVRDPSLSLSPRRVFDSDENVSAMNLVPCLGCGGLFPEMEGPTHRYMESSPGCWAAYGEVLAREYGDRAAHEQTHRLGVDAYAVQHPGRPSPQSIQSVAVHLIRLCLLLECGLEMNRANEAMLKATESKKQFVWLEPPPNKGSITVADIQGASSPEEHAQGALQWARSAWEAWGPHHSQIRLWLPAGFGSAST